MVAHLNYTDTYLYYYNAILDKRHSISIYRITIHNLVNTHLAASNHAFFTVFRWKNGTICTCPHDIIAAAEGKTRFHCYVMSVMLRTIPKFD